MHAIDIVILVIWVTFWLYWLAAATRAKTARRTRSATSRFLFTRLVVIVAVVALLHDRVFPNGWTNHRLVPGVIGLVVVLMGLGFAVWARLHLGVNWGQPMSEKVSPELVTSGPYRYVRHPIYTGLILAGIGTTIAVGLVWLPVTAVAGAFFIYSATVEERNLERLFPDTYPAYKRSTKMLIPFVF